MIELDYDPEIFNSETETDTENFRLILTDRLSQFVSLHHRLIIA